MKKGIPKQRIRKILNDFKSTLTQYKLTFNERAVNEMADTQHTAVILPIKKITRIPGVNSSGKIRFMLKSGQKLKGLLSLSPSGEFSHFTFGKEAAGFTQILNRFLRQKKVLLSDVVVIKAFHSGEYFLKAKIEKQPVQYFVPTGKNFVAIKEAEIIKRHNLQIKQLATAQREYVKMKKAAKSEKLNHLTKLNYL